MLGPWTCTRAQMRPSPGKTGNSGKFYRVIHLTTSRIVGSLIMIRPGQRAVWENQKMVSPPDNGPVLLLSFRTHRYLIPLRTRQFHTARRCSTYADRGGPGFSQFTKLKRPPD